MSQAKFFVMSDATTHNLELIPCPSCKDGDPFICLSDESFYVRCFACGFEGERFSEPRLKPETEMKARLAWNQMRTCMTTPPDAELSELLQSDPEGTVASLAAEVMRLQSTANELPDLRRELRAVKTQLSAFVEYFSAIERGEVGESRPLIRTFEKILLDESRRLLDGWHVPVVPLSPPVPNDELW